MVEPVWVEGIVFDGFVVDWAKAGAAIIATAAAPESISVRMGENSFFSAIALITKQTGTWFHDALACRVGVP